jgi:EpsI family protein
VSATIDNLATPANRGIAVAAAVAVLATAVVMVFRDSYATIWNLWKLSTYQYAFIVVPAAAYLLWSQRAELTAQPVEPSWPVLLLLVGLAMLWQVSRATATQAVEHVVAMLAVPAIVWAVLGRRVLHAAGLSLLLLLMATPVAEVLTPLLMVITADIATGLLGLFGIGFVRAGQYISLSGGEFKIADVCSGLRYLLTGVTLGLLFSYWNFRTARPRAVFVAITAVVFVLGNGLRAFIVMAVASASGMRYLAGHDHVVFGTVLFGVLLGLLLLGARRFAHQPVEPVELKSIAEPPPVNRTQLGAAALGAITALGAGPAIEAYRPTIAPASAELQLPLLPGCSAPAEWRAAWTPVIRGNAIERRGSYRCDRFDVHVVVVAYPTQVAGSELVGSANEIVPSDWWQSGAQVTTHVALGAGRSREVWQTQLTIGTTSVLTWNWYEIDGSPTVSDMGVKLRQALSALAFRAADSRAYVVSVTGPSGAPDALREQAQQAVRALDGGS